MMKSCLPVSRKSRARGTVEPPSGYTEHDADHQRPHGLDYQQERAETEQHQALCEEEHAGKHAAERELVYLDDCVSNQLRRITLEVERVWLAQIDFKQPLRQLCLNAIGKARLSPYEKREEERLDEIDTDQRYHPPRNKVRLRGVPQ